MLYNKTLNTISSNDYCVSYTPYIVLFTVFLAISVIIGGVFIYFYWYLKESNDQSYLKKTMFVLNLILLLKNKLLNAILLNI